MHQDILIYETRMEHKMKTKQEALEMVGKVFNQKLYLVGYQPENGIGGLLLDAEQLQDEIETIRTVCERQKMTERQINNRIKPYVNAIPCTRSWVWGDPVYSFHTDSYSNLQGAVTLTNDLTGQIIK
jgi:hypothetical protein